MCYRLKQTFHGRQNLNYQQTCEIILNISSIQLNMHYSGKQDTSILIKLANQQYKQLKNWRVGENAEKRLFIEEGLVMEL